MSISSGTDFETQIPELSDNANVQDALKLFLYGDVGNDVVAIGGLTQTDGSDGLVGHLNTMKNVTAAKLPLSGGTLTGALSITDTTDSTGPTTGSLNISGGLGVAKKLYVGTNLDVAGTSQLDGAVTITSNLNVGGAINADSTGAGDPQVQWMDDGVVRWRALSDTSASHDYRLLRYSSGGSYQADSLKIAGADGAATFESDVTVGGDLGVAGASQLDGVVVITDTTTSGPPIINPPTGALQVYGGLGVGENLNVFADTTLGGSLVTVGTISTGGVLTVSNATASASPTTGAVVVDGGVGVGGDVFVGDDLDVAGDIRTGGVVRTSVAKTASYTLTDADHLVVFDGTSTKTLTLPLASPGREYIVKNWGTGTVTVIGTSSQLIDTSSEVYLGQRDSITLIGRGTTWMIV